MVYKYILTLELITVSCIKHYSNKKYNFTHTNYHPKVVVRGIMLEIEEVSEDLKQQSYSTLRITRMQERYGPIPLVLIEIGKEY